MILCIPFGTMRKKGSRNSPVKFQKRKRVFKGNQFTKPRNANVKSAFGRKIKTSKTFQVPCNTTLQYCLISFPHVFFSLSTFVKCKLCDKDMSFEKDNPKGLSLQQVVICGCGKKYIDSCKRVEKDYEVNKKIVFVMRLLRVGVYGFQLFCSLMDLTNNFSEYFYYKVIDHIKIATECVKNLVIKKAGKEEQILNANKGFKKDELTVSGDGTWAKRGFFSLIGVRSLIEKYSGKV